MPFSFRRLKSALAPSLSPLPQLPLDVSCVVDTHFADRQYAADSIVNTDRTRMYFTSGVTMISFKPWVSADLRRARDRVAAAESELGVEQEVVVCCGCLLVF